MLANLSANVRAALVTAAVTLVVAALAATYSIGYGNGAKDLETVNDFRKVDLPQIMADLKTLSKELRDRADLANETGQLKKTISSYEADFQHLKNENARLATIYSERERIITELKATVAQAFPKESTSWSIQQGAAERIVPNVLTVGVMYVYASSAYLNINGDSKYLDVGTPYIIKVVGERSCKIEIMKLHGNTVDVVVSCFEK